MDVVVRRFEVCLISLDPAIGSEIRKTRPCVIISPDEMNSQVRTIIVAPMTQTVRGYASRVQCTFQRKRGQIAIDQIRSVDKSRLIRRLGTVDTATQAHILEVLKNMFAP